MKTTLAEYMSESIRNIMTKAYLSAITNPREARFAHMMQRTFTHAEERRRKVKEETGVDVPPFLISSISSTCNLHCKGCYALKNGIASNTNEETKETLTPTQWRTIMSEAASLGVNFSLLAGGEPLMRHDLIEEISSVKEMIFPIFTNGTLIGPSHLDFFHSHLNMIPVISLEGMQGATDDRRGRGIYERVMMSMDSLAKRNLFFGTSLTVTTENYSIITNTQFVDHLHERGCKIIFYVEYVPIDEQTAHLALDDAGVHAMEERLEALRQKYSDIIFLSFPGDEKELGGCLASGRGFFHIGPDGAAEPCPFSPYSDINVAKQGVLGALQSPLFKHLQQSQMLTWEHTGGCTLFEHRNEIEAFLEHNNA